MISVRESDNTAAILVACAGTLLAVGTVMVFSSSMTARPSELEQIYLSRHLAFAAVGVVAAGAVSLLPARTWRGLSPWLVLATAGLLLLVLLPGIGRSVNGAQRWIRWGSLSMQPAEAAKLTLPLLAASVRRWALDRRPPMWLECLLYAAFMLPILVLIVVQPDLGTALFLGGSCVLVLFLGGWPLRNFFWATMTCLPALGSLVVLRPYQWARIQGFWDAWIRPEHAPYQIQQSLTTLGVGGWQGTGLGRGWQKLSFLPEANTDFVFAVIGEELGLFGTLGVVVLWGGVFLAGDRLIRSLPTRSFEAVAARVLLAQLVLQAAVNVAVVTSLVPPKGIPHPFLSYGGSSLVVSCLTIGLIISLTRLPEGAEIEENMDVHDLPSATASAVTGDAVSP